MNWVNKAASVCIWEIQTWRRGERDLGITLGQLSRFSRFWSPFHTMYGCGALVLPLVSISVHSLCVGLGLLWCCWLNVHWRTLWESLSPYFIFSLFFLVFAFLSSPFLSYLFNRGAIRGEGDTGESWGRPEPHGGSGSHCRGDSKRVHFHPTYGFGLWPYCSWGI